MTPEARLERLERIAKPFARAGLRYRRDLNRLEEKINVVVDTQIGNEDRFVNGELKLAKLSETTERRFGKLAENQTITDRKLADLVDFLRRRTRTFGLIIYRSGVANATKVSWGTKSSDDTCTI